MYIVYKEVWGKRAAQYGQLCQFGCGILKMVGPKMQDFCPRINMLKGFFLKQSYDESWFVKKCRNRTFKVNFLFQKLAEFFQKQ